MSRNTLEEKYMYSESFENYEEYDENQLSLFENDVFFENTSSENQISNVSKKLPRTIYLLVGRTGSGKTTVAQILEQEKGWKTVKSYTTRPPRPGEIESGDHLFITSDEVSQYKSDMAAYTKIGDFEYFTTIDVLNQSDIYVIDPNGINSLMSTVGDQFNFMIVNVEATKEIRKQRVMERDPTKANFEAREAAETEQFDKFEKEHQWNIRIKNNEDFNALKKQVIRIFANLSSIRDSKKIIEQGQVIV